MNDHSYKHCDEKLCNGYLTGNKQTTARAH